jgi:polyisoprenoid-binding protein YceI
MNVLVMMVKFPILAAIFLVCLSADDTLWIDLDNTKINWIGRKVTGEHTGTVSLSKGWVIVENDTLKSGLLVFDMNSIINTDIESPEWKLKLENHLKNEDFFAVDSFSQATLKISGSQALSDANSVNNLQIMADLIIRGITAGISFPIVLQTSGDIFSATGNVEIDRTVYGIQYKSVKFFPNIGDKLIDDFFSVQFILKTKTNAKK